MNFIQYSTVHVKMLNYVHVALVNVFRNSYYFFGYLLLHIGYSCTVYKKLNFLLYFQHSELIYHYVKREHKF